MHQYLVERYGDYVLLKPPFKASTYVLWFGPLALLAIALSVGFFSYRRRREDVQVPLVLSAEEQAKLTKLLSPSSSPASFSLPPKDKV